MRTRRSDKKPISKKVKALNVQLARRHGIRELEGRFLIVCEDTKSACRYFEALKKEFSLSATSVEVTHSGGRTQPIQVVDHAIQLKKNAAKRTSGTVPYKSVWCVIDGDFGNKINNARSRAEANDIKLAITTKCFEYWILLHFGDHDTATENCDAVARTLRREYLPGYEKGKYDFKDVVKQVKIASQRAKKTRRLDELPENQNPCSEIYLIINKLLLPSL